MPPALGRQEFGLHQTMSDTSLSRARQHQEAYLLDRVTGDATVKLPPTLTRRTRHAGSVRRCRLRRQSVYRLQRRPSGEPDTDYIDIDWENLRYGHLRVREQKTSWALSASVRNLL
jgi:hypothetical protein